MTYRTPYHYLGALADDDAKVIAALGERMMGEELSRMETDSIEAILPSFESIQDDE